MTTAWSPSRETVNKHGGTTISYTGDPEDSVADFEPRDIHGVLEDGTEHLSGVKFSKHALKVC
ncbi:Uncharacterised protein [Mycobacteroides abscessus subsp. massiliense]|nr:Uncharacterised protein [Mycobacteroides abscessus subsp. massiliense]SKU06344.1 Uncharacterised protein [Mycobacteroides abscessus subsp. massiliense]